MRPGYLVRRTLWIDLSFKPPVNYLVEYAMPIQAACGDYSLLEEKGTQLSRFSFDDAARAE